MKLKADSADAAHSASDEQVFFFVPFVFFQYYINNIIQSVRDDE